LGIYHSHPHGPAEPSPTDIAEFAYPGVFYLIWSKVKDKWECNGYSIKGVEIQQIQIEIISCE
jgi:proteasome lid subunit RPN8/RPN11